MSNNTPLVKDLRISGEAAREIITNVKNITWRRYLKAPLWSLVADITGHGSGYSISVCLSANLNPHQLISSKPLQNNEPNLPRTPDVR